MTAEPLADLRRAAEVKRAARRRLADATAVHGQRSGELDQYRQAHQVAAGHWVTLVRLAALAGHPVADIARAAGVASSSIHYRLRSTSVEMTPAQTVTR